MSNKMTSKDFKMKVDEYFKKTDPSEIVKQFEAAGYEFEDIEMYIDCIGVDELHHVCLPESDVCKCGVKVKRKKMLRDDWQKFCCYQCTY